jgi:serine protease
VRVALVGDAVDPAVCSLAGIESRVEPPYLTQNASEQGIGIGAASLGHILDIAPHAVVCPVSILSAEGAASGGDLHEGVVAALAARPEVLILGVGFPAAPQSPQLQQAGLDLEELLARRAGKVLVVAPAGNDAQPKSAWPAALDRVVSVAAIGEDGRRAPFSNFGVGVDLAAPGVEITCLLGAESGRPTFRDMSGTTFSADIVAGVAALVMSVSDRGPSEVVQLLLRAATRRTPDGTPILDALALVRIALGDTTE